MDRLRGISQGGIDALKSLVVALALIAVALRLIANWRFNRCFMVDDYISITAIPLLIAVSIVSDVAGSGFSDPDASRHDVAELGVALAVLCPLAIWTCKAPVFFSYIHAFGVKKWLRRTSIITLVFMSLVYSSGIVAIPPVCAPRSGRVSLDQVEACQIRTRIVSLYIGIVSVVVDIVILVLPIPVICGLTLLPPSRVGLFILFLCGFVAIAASIVSVYYKAVSLSTPATSLALSILATVTESAIALIVGCVPSVRVLWCKILRPRAGKASEVISSVLMTVNRRNSQSSTFEAPERKASDLNNLVISTEVHTSTTTMENYSQQQQHNRVSSLTFNQPYLHTYYRPGEELFDEEYQSPFGVHSEAYAMRTGGPGQWR
ncbi:hypothetical protein GGS21DRAFT_508619 [Xylaria nigripes]|nr:hypothetical protein GGS21DRAFT_508619 [Xylaria nigripes]